jgi:hypothetical protein
MYNRKQQQRQHQQHQQHDDDDDDDVNAERQSFLPTTSTRQQEPLRHRILSHNSSSNCNSCAINKNSILGWNGIGISSSKLQLGLLWMVLLVMTLEVWNNYNSNQSVLLSLSETETRAVQRTTQLPATTTMTSLPLVTQFDDSCYMESTDDDDHHDAVEKETKIKKANEKKKQRRQLYDHSENVPHVGRRGLLSQDEDEDDEEESDDEESDDESSDDDATGISGKLDHHQLGRCVAEYFDRVEPSKGWLQDLDWFHFRSQHAQREACYLYCIDQWNMINQNKRSKKNKKSKKKNDNDISLPNALLSQAVIMGLTRVVEKLVQHYQMDPLEPVLWTLQRQQREEDRGGIDWAELHGSNAIQHAIRMGQAEMVAIMTPSIHTTPIDDLGRTVMDYITLKGSPIRPVDAKQYLQVDTTRSQNVEGIHHIHGGTTPRNVESTKESDFEAMLHQSPGQGWNENTLWPATTTERCDIDIVYGSMSRQTFYQEYLLPGRPFVLRGIIPQAEITAFRRSRWETSLPRFQPDTAKVWVGPTAYPYLTGQESCEEKMTIAQIEAGQQCPDLPPDTPILHAWHPSDRVSNFYLLVLSLSFYGLKTKIHHEIMLKMLGVDG